MRFQLYVSFLNLERIYKILMFQNITKNEIKNKNLVKETEVDTDLTNNQKVNCMFWFLYFDFMCKDFISINI